MKKPKYKEGQRVRFKIKWRDNSVSEYVGYVERYSVVYNNYQIATKKGTNVFIVNENSILGVVK